MSNALEPRGSGLDTGGYGLFNGRARRPSIGHLKNLFKSQSRPVNGQVKDRAAKRHRIFIWSTHEENIAGKSGAVYAEHLAQRKEVGEEVFLDNLSYTLCSRRSMLPWKSFLVADSLADLVEKVAATRQKPVRASIKPLRLAFVFTGQGAQWFAVGRELAQVYPLFQRRLQHADAFVKNLGANWSLVGKDPWIVCYLVW